MQEYDHQHYAETIAASISPLCDTQTDRRVFRAFGIEDLYDFQERLSTATGHILITVDGYEVTTSANQASGLFSAREYGLIIASSTIADRPETIAEAYQSCYNTARQIRAYLYQDPQLSGIISPETTINGIGPIGDNFYGCLLTYTITEPETYTINPAVWRTPQP